MFSYYIDAKSQYPAAPFSPDKPYPELSKICTEIDPSNHVYAAVREVFLGMGWDSENFGTPDWNPLGHIIDGKTNIVIKPNLVIHRVGEVASTINSLVAHASVMRPLIDYILLAAQKAGNSVNIAIADTPLQSADFGALCEANGLHALMAHYQACDAPVSLYDLRFEHAVINDHFMILRRVPLPGDPAGACIVDMGEKSAHYTTENKQADFSIQDYDDEATRGNHTGSVHRYKFSQTVLNADVVFNVAKLKCHAKAGVTLGLKNIVGANVSKDYLPHFRSGAPETGGDECPRLTFYTRSVRTFRNWFNRGQKLGLAPLHSLLKKLAYLIESQRQKLGQETGFGGAWYGNDTLWRTIVDINRILFYADRDGRLQESPQRKVILFLDGVYGMQGNGPLKGTDVHAGLIACSDDPVEFDAKITFLMGFDPAKIPHIDYWRRASSMSIGSFPTSFSADLRACHIPLFEEPNSWKGKMRR